MQQETYALSRYDYKTKVLDGFLRPEIFEERVTFSICECSIVHKPLSSKQLASTTQSKPNHAKHARIPFLLVNVNLVGTWNGYGYAMTNLGRNITSGSQVVCKEHETMTLMSSKQLTAGPSTMLSPYLRKQPSMDEGFTARIGA